MSSNDFKIYHYEKNSVNFLDNLTLVPDSKHVAFLIPLALFVNIYFRKSFSFAKNFFQLCFCFFVFLVGGNSTKLFDYVSLEMWSLMIISFFAFCSVYYAQELNIDSQDFIQFVCTFGAMSELNKRKIAWMDISKGTYEGDQMAELLATMWVNVPLLAMFQIIRNPLFIKNWLRPIRVGLGPTSFLWTVFSAYLQTKTEMLQPEMSWFSILILTLALTSGLCSFLAVVFFRPDNTQLFLVIFSTNIDKICPLSTRTRYHGALNLLAVFLSTCIYFILKTN